MKKILLTAGTLILASTICLAHDPGGKSGKETRKERKEVKNEKKAESKSEVSYFTEMNFSFDFPAAQNAVFEKTKNFDEVSFMNGNKLLRAYYDIDNHLVGTTESVPVSALPVAAQKTIAKKYPDYEISQVILFDDNELNSTDMILYGNSFEDEDNYFAELNNADHNIILKSNQAGAVSLFKKIN